MCQYTVYTAKIPTFSVIFYQKTTDYARYTSTNTNTITNLAVTSFYENSTVSAVIRITFPTGMSYPTSTDESGNNDNKIYFMVYLLWW